MHDPLGDQESPLIGSGRPHRRNAAERLTSAAARIAAIADVQVWLMPIARPPGGSDARMGIRLRRPSARPPLAAEVGHGGDDRSGSATVCLVHVAGHDSEQHRPVADPPRCQQTVVETCVPTLVSSSRLWTGQKIDHPVRVVNVSRAASPAVEFPDGPSAGLHTQIVQRSGMTARMPPPTPLFAGNPTR
jgi:hypothetical protein